MKMAATDGHRAYARMTLAKIDGYLAGIDVPLSLSTSPMISNP
jgi:hypothetical protein